MVTVGKLELLFYIEFFFLKKARLKWMVLSCISESVVSTKVSASYCSVAWDFCSSERGQPSVLKSLSWVSDNLWGVTAEVSLKALHEMQKWIFEKPWSTNALRCRTVRSGPCGSYKVCGHVLYARTTLYRTTGLKLCKYLKVKNERDATESAFTLMNIIITIGWMLLNQQSPMWQLDSLNSKVEETII